MTESTTSTAVIIPVGQHGGQSPAGADGARQHAVRRGAETERLSEPEFLVWSMAHNASSVGEAATVAADLYRLAGPEPIVAGLLERGLLVKVALDTGSAAAFAATHRMVPMMLGLGNEPDRPDWYGLGFPPEPSLLVPLTTFVLWQQGHLEPSLWAACEAVADLATDGQLAPERVLLDLLTGVHQLLAVHAVHFDLARAA